MLVLTRRINESIKIGDDIEITILSVSGEQIKIGIEAPKHIEIHRKEVYIDIQNENNQASQTSIDLLKQLNINFKNTRWSKKISGIFICEIFVGKNLKIY